jgi:CBS domain-containing protein
MAWPLLWLAGLLVAKWVATAATVGAGTVGGVFTPTLFVGAGAGALFGTALHQLGGSAAGVPAGAFALVGMGAVLAATTRSPLLAMIMIFELSLDYSLVPPLMLACVVSILVARQLHGESVYMEHMRVKGLALGQETSRPGAVMEQTVGDLMRAPVAPVRETTPLREIADRFLTNSNNFLPVVDARTAAAGRGGVAGFEGIFQRQPGLEGGHRLRRDAAAAEMPHAGPAVARGAAGWCWKANCATCPSSTIRRKTSSSARSSRAEVLAIFSEAIAAKSDPTR